MRRMTWFGAGLVILAACGGGGGGGESGDDDPGEPGAGPYFPSGAFYYDDISGVEPVGNSDAITAYMEATHGPNGWGFGEMRIDFSIIVNQAPAGTTRLPFEIDPDFYYPPECDLAPVPLPAGGAVEVDWENPPTLQGLQGYACTSFDDGGDCHILVFAPDEDRLYEIYHGTVRDDGTFIAGCEAIWDTSTAPPLEGRGHNCTSADAAGYAIAPLLVTPDEVAAAVAGTAEIGHAIRLILPNDIIRGGTYHSPATHGTNSSGPADTVPYGGRMRLRADFPLDTLSPAAQAVARAMQRHGMLLADGGNIALTMSSDALSTTKWADVGLEPRSLDSLLASDFDVIIDGPAFVTGATDCDRTAIED